MADETCKCKIHVAGGYQLNAEFEGSAVDFVDTVMELGVSVPAEGDGSKVDYFPPQSIVKFVFDVKDWERE